MAGSSGKKQKSRKRKRVPWAQLLKRTFKIDALTCDRCGGRMKLIGVEFDQPTITTTLRALNLPVRAPRRTGALNWKMNIFALSREDVLHVAQHREVLKQKFLFLAMVVKRRILIEAN